MKRRKNDHTRRSIFVRVETVEGNHVYMNTPSFETTRPQEFADELYAAMVEIQKKFYVYDKVMGYEGEE